MKRSLVLLLLFLLMFTTGCSEEKVEDSFDLEKPAETAITPKKSDGTLKIMSMMPENFITKWFDDYYGGFKNLYPELKIELISVDVNFSMVENIKQKKPDIVFFRNKQYRELVAAGVLAEVQENRLDMQNMDSFLISYLKSLAGDGKLYGLTDFYTASVLQYKKSLFDKYKVEYPKENMTWEEIFQTAKRFTDSDREDRQIFGLSVAYMSPADPYIILDHMRKSYNMSFIDDAGNFNVHTEQWKRLFNTVLNGYQSGTIAPFQPAIILGTEAPGQVINYWFENRAAMTLSGLYLGEQPDDIVTIPLPVGPDGIRTRSYEIEDIGSITSFAEQSEEAWEFFKYAYGEQAARNNLPKHYIVPARAYILPGDQAGPLERFFDKGTTAEQFMKDQRVLLDHGADGEEALKMYLNDALKNVLDNKKTLDEAIDELERQVHDVWERGKEDKK